MLRCDKNLSIWSITIEIIMQGLGSVKSCVVLSLAITLCIWDTKWLVKAKPDYWNLLPRFIEANITYNIPKPREQSILYQTVEEITTPITVKATGNIPEWLKGIFHL